MNTIGKKTIDNNSRSLGSVSRASEEMIVVFHSIVDNYIINFWSF